jgi:methionyl-tRNA formyltransferase
MPRVVLLTSDALRHRFVRAALAAHPTVELVATFAEPHAEAPDPGGASVPSLSSLERRHLRARAEVEADFFEAAVDLVSVSSPLRSLQRGEVNDPQVVDAILALEPDVLATFGCSILRRPLIEALPGRIVNLHLGLSPYYRGSGTNFWPLANGEPELVGATFLQLDAGIDTGPVIHQLRARVHRGDSVHQIGNRLIADAGRVFPQVLDAVARAPGPLPPAPPEPPPGRVYRRAQLDEAAVAALEQQFADGLIDRYLDERDERCQAAPIVEHPAVPPLEGPG